MCSEIRLVLSHCPISNLFLLCHLSVSDSEEASARDKEFLEMSGPPEHPAQVQRAAHWEGKADTTEVLSRNCSAGSVKIKPLQGLGQRLK